MESGGARHRKDAPDKIAFVALLELAGSFEMDEAVTTLR